MHVDAAAWRARSDPVKGLSRRMNHPSGHPVAASQHAARERRPAEPLALAIDIGSSSIRSMVFDRHGWELPAATVQRAYAFDTAVEGQVTIDADVVLDVVVECVDGSMQALDATRASVQAVGISCFWHSLLGLNTRLRPITPVFHLADNRSASMVDELRRSLDEPYWHEATGVVFHSSFWPAKLRWHRHEAPSVHAAVHRWTSVADYVAGRLLGTDSTSICMASGTGLLDTVTGKWCHALTARLDIDQEILPPIVDRGTPAYLLEPWRQRWPRIAAVPWYPPLGDGACANVGAGATNPSRVAMTLGTTGAARVLDRSPLGQPVTRQVGLWTYRLDAQTTVRGAAITNGGIWFDFVRSMLADAEGISLQEAFDLPPGRHGLTVLPFLAGERAPIWNDRARAVIAGLSPGSTRAEITRASLEAVIHRLALIYEDVAEAARSDHRVVANGAALLRSPGLQQMLADAIQHPIVTLPETIESSARGAAICALERSGAIASLDDVEDFAAESPSVEPNPDNAGVYRSERARQEAFRALLYPHGTTWDQSLDRE
jgi:gluconokinase